MLINVSIYFYYNQIYKILEIEHYIASGYLIDYQNFLNENSIEPKKCLFAEIRAGIIFVEEMSIKMYAGICKKEEVAG